MLSINDNTARERFLHHLGDSTDRKNKMQTLLNQPQGLCAVLQRQLIENMLRKWYPLTLDTECGGFFTNLTANWELPAEQEKMIVSQARHMWMTSKAASFLTDGSSYEQYARHGLRFIKEHMWDDTYGGFFQIRNRRGGYSDCRGWRSEKRTYGNACAIYALAALYGLTEDPAVLDLATDAFHWVEDHAYDPVHRGYFQFLTREGKPFDRTSRYTTVAEDRLECGYKDQNSSIHLLEAYTELYRVWRDPTLMNQLTALLHLIRDTMVTEKGYLHLFFTRNWTPVQVSHIPGETCIGDCALDHISFGHDCETAFLLLEASHALGAENDARTLHVAQRMLVHSIMNGWDQQHGGFFDGGHYVGDSTQCTIVRKAKPWWAQAEALNTLLIFSHLFPDDKCYHELFEQQWEYIDNYLLDHQRGDWFEGGLDQEPDYRNGPKSHMRKCTYHTGRALMNCIALLSDANEAGPGVRKQKQDLQSMITHWRRV